MWSGDCATIVFPVGASGPCVASLGISAMLGIATMISDDSDLTKADPISLECPSLVSVAD